jgi:predicted DNA-binding antitoxin AbrB/MazE fold protein
MTEIIEALYDGAVFCPDEPIALAPNTRVRLVVETLPPAGSEAPSFLRTARALRLDGPADWSENLDEHLYGTESANAV